MVYLLNAGPEMVPFSLPAFVEPANWECLLDTFDDRRQRQLFEGGQAYPLAENSLAVFRLDAAGKTRPRP